MSEMAQETFTTVYDVQVNGLQGMNALVETTQQYSAAADTMLGKVGKVNATLGMAGRSPLPGMRGLRPENRAATSEAARYQQQLSQLEATTAVATRKNGKFEKSFKEISDITKKLARDMPVGMKEAVAQVDSLQQSGIKSNKEIKVLSEHFTKLGKANSEFGPALGSNMIDLSRNWQAGTKEVVAYGDALTAVTQELGGTASGTVDFAKAIAPIASTVGMGESRVLGLANAFSRMGEDGIGATTAVNKVMLDMNRSIRQGTPEIGTYARLLDVSVGELTTLFEKKPDEVLTRFVEAIQQKGPDAIQELEMLGLDGVRTARSVQAVARSGQLRESIATAVSGYDSGATDVGAEAAMSGLNDQLTRLQETTKQTIEAGGRPFVDMLEDIVRVGADASQITNQIVSSDVAQSFGKATAVGGGIGGAIMDVAGAGLMMAMGRNVLRGGAKFLGGARTDFRMGRQAMHFTGDRDLARASAVRSPAAAAAGARAATMFGGPGADPGATAAGRGRAAMRGVNAAGMMGARAALGGMNTLLRSAGFDVKQARSADGVRPMTAARGVFQGDMQAARAQATLGARATATGAAIGKLAGSAMMADTSLKRMAATTALTGARAVVGGAGYAGGLAARGVGRVGRAMAGMGVTPGFAGAAFVGYTAYKGWQANKEREEAAEGNADAAADPHRAYNEFAAALGQAGRSTSGFADAAQRAADRLNQINPSKGDQYEISSEEVRAAASYEGPYGLELSDAYKGKQGMADKIWGFLERDIVSGSGLNNPFNDENKGTREATAGELTARAAMTLGDRAPKEDVSRMLFDLLAQDVDQATVTEVGKRLKGIYGDEGRGTPSYGLGFSASYAAQERQPTLSGPSEDATSMMAATFGRVGQEAERIGGVYGEKSARVATYAEVDKLMTDYSERRKGMGEKSRKALDELYASSLAGALGVDVEDIKSYLDSGSVSELMGRIKDPTENSQMGIDAFRDLGLTGAIGMEDILAVGQRPGYIKRDRRSQRGLSDDYEAVTGDKPADKAYDEAIYGVSDKLFDMGKTLEDGGKALKAGMTPLQRALYELQTERPSTSRTFRAADKLAGAALQRFGDNAGVAQMSLMSSAVQQEDPEVKEAMIQAAGLITEKYLPKIMAEASPVGAIQARIQAGHVAMRQLKGDDSPEAEQARIDIVKDQAAAQAEMIQMRRQYQEQVIDTMRQIRIANENAAIQESRANEDYQRSRLYAEQDYNTSIFRNRRNFQIQMSDAQKDFQISMQYAAEDYHRQRRYAEQDHYRSRRYAQQDFHRAMAHAQQDFIRQRSRAVADYNRQVEYMLKDAAKTMLNPYERIQAADVMDARGLAANLQEQAGFLRRQSKNVKRLKQLGLSQNTIDQLDLYNPANAYQAERLVQDIEQDRNAAAQLNRAAGAKAGASSELTQQSEEFRRQQKEFRIGQRRMTQDYRTAMSRQTQAFRISMNRQAQDFAKQMNRMGEQHRVSTQRALEQNRRMRSRAMRDHRTAMSDAAEDYERAMSRMSTQHGVAMQRMHEDVARSNRLTLEQLAISGRRLTQTSKDIARESMRAIAGAPRNWRGPLVQSVNVMNNALRAAVNSGMPRALTMHFQPVRLSAGQASRKAINNAISIGENFFAEGGVAMRPMRGMVAEAGYPEAIVPLNERGAELISEVLKRYVTPGDAMTARTHASTTPASQVSQTYLYDYSTRVESVQVVANDPHEMFRKLEDIASTQRLIQPAGNQS